MKKIISIFTLLLFVFTFNLNAQKQMNWWYFGYGAGLDFNQLQIVNGVIGLPKPIKGPIDTYEGCFVLSDSNGNLLMSSDGVTVYNKNNVVMANGRGLKGNFSATQSGIVIPMPGNFSKFYIVTVEAVERGTQNGLNYSIADLSDGIGIITTKNVKLKAGKVGENIAAVRHSNGKDYWLIHRTGRYFYVWAITSSGFSTTPVSYDATIDLPFHPGKNNGGIGELRFDASGTRLVHVDCAVNSYITMANFDPSTGVISNIKYKQGYDHLYGVEFSPSGEYIYISTYKNKLSQIKFADFMNGSTTLTNLNKPICNMKLGPDNRIYGVSYSNKDMYVIINPDEGGSNIKMFSNYLLANAGLGLPVFSASWININMDADNVFCFNTQKSFNLKIEMFGSLSQKPKYTVWDFGDGTNLTAFDDTNIPGNQSKTHTYDRPGNYKITVKIYDESKNEIPEMMQTFDVNVKPCLLPVNPNNQI